jgi:hypothetical protein
VCRVSQERECLFVTVFLHYLSFHSDQPMRTVPRFSRTLSSARSFHISVSNAFPRRPPARTTATEIPLALRDAASTEGITTKDFEQTNLGTRAQWSLDDIVDNEKDISSAGHVYLGQQRQNLHYLRLIEHEMPKLVGEHAFQARVCMWSDTQS